MLITDEVRPPTGTTRWPVMAARRRALTRLPLRLRPTEWIFVWLGVLMVTLIIFTGQFSALAARYLVTLKFALVIASVTTVMFLRVYYWPTVAERAGSALGRREARIRYAWRSAARSLREFSPVFGLLAIYEVLHLLTPILAPQVHDAALIRIDHAVFGVDVGRWLDDHLGSPSMTKVMTYCYVSYAFASPIYAGVLYLRRKHRAFHDFALAIAITALLGYSGYLLVPAIGPYLYQAELYPDQLPGWGDGGILDLIASAKGAARDAFPSLHTAMTTVLLGSLWRDARRLFWIYLPVGLGLYVATMYLRVHYAVDVAAGFAVAAIALAAAPKINQWYARMCDRHSVSDPTPTAATTPTYEGDASSGAEEGQMDEQRWHPMMT